MSTPDQRAEHDGADSVDHRRSLLKRLAPHWPLVVTLAIVAAAVLWWASYGVAS